jgi:hypothetical protein
MFRLTIRDLLRLTVEVGLALWCLKERSTFQYAKARLDADKALPKPRREVRLHASAMYVPGSDSDLRQVGSTFS